MLGGGAGMVRQMGEEHEVTVGGIRLAYQVSGDPGAEPMLLLHALGEQASTWAQVTARFTERYRIFAVDLRGHGSSDWPGTYSLQLMRDDVIALIDQLGLRQVVLVGHSMGGAVAYLVAMARPDQVGRLIIEEAAPPFRRDRAIPARPPGPLDFDWPVAPAISSQVSEGDPEAWELLRTITAPTLLIGGGPQSHVPQDLLGEAAARVPSCQLMTIPAGHNVHATRPAEFSDAVFGWLTRK
jgi:3-oxoadipate enol-lactonase